MNEKNDAGDGFFQISKKKRSLVHLGAIQITGNDDKGSGIYTTLAKDAATQDAVIGITFFRCEIQKTEWGSIKNKRLAASKPSVNLSLLQARKLLVGLTSLIKRAAEGNLV